MIDEASINRLYKLLKNSDIRGCSIGFKLKNAQKGRFKLKTKDRFPTSRS
ncbi:MULTISPECIES: HK97 family phage prohead protease [Salegentibacter]